MRIGAAIRWLALGGGVVLALDGLLCLLAAGLGQIKEGRGVMLAVGLTSLALSVPLFALPFSSRVARNAILVVLCPLALLLVWVVFQGERAQWVHQLAVIAFTLLLGIRLWLTFRPQARLGGR